MTVTENEIRKAITDNLVNPSPDGVAWDIAENAEELGLCEITSSKFQRKTADLLQVRFNAKALAFVGALPCDESGVCQTCVGAGEHLRFSDQYEECTTCRGTGDCPCQTDMFIHSLNI